MPILRKLLEEHLQRNSETVAKEFIKLGGLVQKDMEALCKRRTWHVA